MELELNLILYILSVVMASLFTGALTAIELLSLGGLERGSDEQDSDKGFVARLLDDPILNGVAVGIARFLSVACVIVFAVRYLVIHSGSSIPTNQWVLAAAVIASLYVPVMLSKLLAVLSAERFLLVTKPLLLFVIITLRPFAVAASKLASRLSPTLIKLISFQVIPLKEKIGMLGSANGAEHSEEQRIMSSILDFGETRVREVMIPRVDIIAVNTAMDREESLDVIISAGHSRILLYEETIDKMIGTVYTKDLLRRIASDEDFSMREIARETFFVPESKMIDELLTEFRSRRQHLAVVVDEYGGTAGIVTLEDVLEELVGDIQDEFDAEEALIQQRTPDTVVCNAKIRVEDLNETLGLDLSEEFAESLGGLLYHQIGRVPRSGDRWEHHGITFEIQSVVRQRIENVLISGLGSLDVDIEDNTG